MSSTFPELPPSQPEDESIGETAAEQIVQPEETLQPEEIQDAPAPEEELPPEAQGETNGGPLGCCLGMVVGLLLTAMLITTLSVILSNGGYLSFATLPTMLLGSILCGYFGWKIGKRVYREYEPPVVKVRTRKTKSRTKARPRRV